MNVNQPHAAGRRHARRRRPTPVDFDVGEAEVIEQSLLEIEDITLTGEHEVSVHIEVVPAVTMSGEHRIAAKSGDHSTLRSESGGG